MPEKTIFLQDSSRKLIWFFAIGMFNTTLGFGLFPTIYFIFPSYRKHYVLALVFCQIICIISSYLTNKLLVFRSHGDYLTEMVKFITFHFVYFIILVSVVPLLVGYYKFNPVVIQLGIGTLVVVTSYYWYNNFTFLSQK